MPLRVFRKVAKFAIIFFVFQTISISIPLKANAANKVWSTTTPLDVYNRPDLPTQYDILRVEVGLYDNDLDLVHFWIQFKNPLLPSQFNDGRDSWAGILIDSNGDDKEDFRVSTYSYTYSKNFGQNAFAGKWDGASRCNAVSWMDLEENSPYLGFKVSQKCLGFSNKFKVMGYSDYSANDNSSFDYAPDAFATIDLGDYYNPKPKVTTPVPFSSNSIGKQLSNYSNPPENLSNLVSELRDSVVTIECIVGETGGTGTGWAASVQMPEGRTSQTYLITNYHVISDCIYRGTVDVILNNKTKVVGTLAAWDPDNDLAGIYISTKLNPMTWQGVTPLQGGWAGVLGSPKGLPGVLTTGIVSSVDTNNVWITFTAPINPGNSGGPVFDSTGRVMAIATAKARDSEGFGIGNGVPLLCEVVIRCGQGQSGWSGVSAKISNDFPRKLQSIDLSTNLTTVNSAVRKTLAISFTPTIVGDITVRTTSGLIPELKSETPLICQVNSGTVNILSTGTCTIRADQSGSADYSPAPTARIFIGIYFTKILKTQVIQTDVVQDVFLSDKEVAIRIYATSNLEVQAKSDDYNTCSIFRDRTTYNEYVIILNDVGVCGINLSQVGNSDYSPAPDKYLSFEILPAEKKTITCFKGKIKKKVTAVNPKCPVGFKRK